MTLLIQKIKTKNIFCENRYSKAILKRKTVNNPSFVQDVGETKLWWFLVHCTRIPSLFLRMESSATLADML
jgi:hypothetical protein